MTIRTREKAVKALAGFLFLFASAGAAAQTTVSLSAPANNAVYALPATITLKAAASATSPSTITRVEFYANGALVGTDTTKAYSFAWANPQAGSYTLTAIAYDSSGGQASSSARTITVNAANLPPTVNLSGPANNATFALPATITLTAGASAPEANDTVARVDFYANGALIGTDTSKAYSFAWTNPAPGTYTLTAVATDGQGAQTTSAARTITVNPANLPPTVNLTGPANNAIYALPATITLTAGATAPEANDTVAKVDFFANGVLIGTDTTKAYSFAWTNPNPGTYTLTAVATDGQGAQTTSAARTITVNAANLPPTVTLKSPANNAVLAQTASITVLAGAAAPEDNDTVARVDFYANGTLIGSDATKAYSIVWANPNPGTYTLTAIATDGQGAQTTSAARTVTVDAAPTVTLSTDNALYASPASVTLTATPSDSVGTITKIDFYQGTTLIGTATAAPYSFTWTNVASGAYSLTAVATNDAGAASTSSAVSITVDTAPNVTLSSNGASFTAPATIALTATASDTVGNVTKVDFYQGTTLIGTASAAPYTFNWTSVPIGNYSVTAVATNDAGETTTSPAIAISVSVPVAQMFFIQVDHLNTPRLVTDQNQQPVWRSDNTEAFGDSAPNGDPNHTGNVFDFALRFPGQYFDRETGGSYNLFRYFAADLGRYQQSDPIGLGGGLNTYAYASGNPLKRIDRLGLSDDDLLGTGKPSGIGIPDPSAQASRIAARQLQEMLDRLFCPQCIDIQAQINEKIVDLRVRYLQATADVHNLFCDRPYGAFSWMGHQFHYNVVRQELKELVELAKSMPCPYDPEADDWINRDFPVCPASRS
jgi:RHS repeat-associated protein